MLLIPTYLLKAKFLSNLLLNLLEKNEEHILTVKQLLFLFAWKGKE